MRKKSAIVGKEDRLRMSAPGKRVHFASYVRAFAGTVREIFGSRRVPPKVKVTEWSLGGDALRNQTTAEDTRASANCTSFGSKR
jgi:hypothetical protein